MRTMMILAALALVGCGDKETPDDSSSTDDSSADDSSPDSTADSETLDGEALYAAHCASCHGVDGRGGSGPDLQREMGHSDESLVHTILNGDGKMAPVDCTEAQAYAIVGYLRVLLP